MSDSHRCSPMEFFRRGVAAYDRQDWFAAIETLLCAVDGLDQFETPGEFLKSHYCLGRAFEVVGDKPAAEKHYFAVLAFDYTYEDAAERIEKVSPD